MSYSTAELSIVAGVVVLFIVQLYYYLILYARIPSYRNSKRGQKHRQVSGVSMIVVLTDDYDYLEQTLPMILSQDCSNFEVVIVDLGSNDDFSDAISTLKDSYHNLTSTKIEQDPRFPISNKMALNVGIKASSYDYIVLSTADTYPTSDKWLSFMTKGFETADVVLGYCGVEIKQGFVNKLQRCSRLVLSVRYLASAVAGRPYRGVIQNMGFSKRLYFDVKGFNYLNMNMGEDDLFMQRIATAENTSIVMNPYATLRQRQWGGIDWWRSRRLFYSNTYRYYPSKIRFYVNCEIFSRVLIFLISIIALILLPPQIKIVVGSILVLRFVVVEFEFWRIGKRLGEKGLFLTVIIYDFIAPLSELMLFFGRRFRKVNGVWR